MSQRTSSHSLGNLKLELRVGNIAYLDVDAIVNAANERLNLGTGVGGALSEVGGSAIQKECNEIGFCSTGSAVMTGGGMLKAKYVIHAVGPMYGEGGESEKLRSAVQSAISLADKKGLNSIAVPAISAGLFHYPMNECAQTMIAAIKDLAPELKNIDRLIICLHSDKKFDVFEKELRQ